MPCLAIKRWVFSERQIHNSLFGRYRRNSYRKYSEEIHRGIFDIDSSFWPRQSEANVQWTHTVHRPERIEPERSQCEFHMHHTRTVRMYHKHRSGIALETLWQRVSVLARGKAFPANSHIHRFQLGIAHLAKIKTIEKFENWISKRFACFANIFISPLIVDTAKTLNQCLNSIRWTVRRWIPPSRWWMHAIHRCLLRWLFAVVSLRKLFRLLIAE